MEVIVWNEDLGSDDDAATEEESHARILFYWPPRSVQEQLRVLQLLQGTYAFASTFTKTPPASTLTHVQLTNKHYCFERVEPKVWIALGHAFAKDTDQNTMEAVLRGMYSSFRILHGGIDWLLRSMEPCTDLPEDMLDAMVHTGLNVLLELAECRKKMRKMTMLISKIRHDEDTQECAAATAALAKLSACAAALAAASPAHRLQSVLFNFFPLYLWNLGVVNLNCMHEMNGIPNAPADGLLQMAGHMLAQSLRADVPAVLHCASFHHGQLVCGGGWDATHLHLVHRFLCLREQHVVSQPKATSSATSPWLSGSYPESFEPIWALKQTYIDGGVRPPKKRMSAKDLFADAIATANSAASMTNAGGFETTDGAFVRDAGPDKLWRLPLFDLHRDGKSTRDLVVWHDGACTLLLCVQAQANSSALAAAVAKHLGQSVYLGAFDGAAVPASSQSSPSAFVHLNRQTKQFQLHNLGKFKGPVPPLLLASCFHSRVLDALKCVRHDLAIDDGIMDIFTKTAFDGWIVVRRSGSLDRELVAFMDAKAVDSIADLSTSMNTLIHTAFDTIFM